MSLIIADHRENAIQVKNKEKLSTLHFMKEHVSKHNESHPTKIIYEKQEITTGDYAIFTCDDDKKIIRMIIERKTWKDLSGSIVDRRIDSQINNMIEQRTKFNVRLLIIVEGAIGYDDNTRVGGKHGLQYKNLYGKLINTFIKYDIPYINTKDTEHTAKTIIKYADMYAKLLYNKELPEIMPADMISTYKTIINTTNNMYIGKDEDLDKIIDNVNDCIKDIQIKEGGEEYVMELKKRHENTDSNTIANIWNCIPGITNNNRHIISFNIKFREIIENNAAEKIALLKYPSGNKIGDKRAKNIVINDEKIFIKMLTCINGISEKAAKSIAKEIKIIDIFDQDKLQSISMIKRENNRNIGISIQNKIITIFKQIDINYCDNK